MQFSQVAYSPEKTIMFLGWPQVVRRADGALLATHDYFGICVDMHLRSTTSMLYISEDDGATWSLLMVIPDAVFGSLFEHKGDLYFVSSTYTYGAVTIRKSTDGGYTWSFPIDEKNGLIFPKGGFIVTPMQFHKHNGRIYKSVDYKLDYPSQDFSPSKYSVGVISAPEDADLMDSASWTVSEPIHFEQAQCPDQTLVDANSGWLEGNMVTGPDGELYDMVRIHLTRGNKAALIHVQEGGKKLDFDYSSGIVDFFSGRSKFLVRRDPETGYYLAMTNELPDETSLEARNILILAVSEDLRHWVKAATLLRDDTGMKPEDSVRYTGFQYPDWHFDGDDIIYVSRTAYRGACSYHDSNRVTFHKIRNYKKIVASAIQ